MAFVTGDHGHRTGPFGAGRDDVVSEYADLAADLRRAVDSDVRFDEYAQILYATDGSIYQVRPAGAAEPQDVDDVRAAVRVAADHNVPIIARGAGSPFGGQAVGPGCVVPTVPADVLAEYTQTFMDILEDHDTSAAYFAHAGSGSMTIHTYN